MKKLFALLLALAMVFSMGLGAVAEEPAEEAEAIPELAAPVAGQYTYRMSASTMPTRPRMTACRWITPLPACTA